MKQILVHLLKQRKLQVYSRDHAAIYALNSISSFNRGLFYWVLAHHRLPNMWRYRSACNEAAKISGDDIPQLGGSILTRCARALEARDEIGKQFYIPQNNDTRDRILYHFDYFNLLISGAFDAQARVARRAYGISKPDERNAGFRNQAFLQALGRTNAQQLHQIVTGQNFKDVMALIFTLRNTIHGAGLDAVGYQAVSQPQHSLIAVPLGDVPEILDAAKRCGSPEHWGLVQEYRVLLDPYTFVVTLLAESFRLLDAVAAATDIRGLFPVGHVLPPLTDKPPADEVFGEAVRQRLAVLG